MNNLNQIIIEGKIEEKPNYQTLLNGIKNCLFVISVERNYYSTSIGEMVKEVYNFKVMSYGNLADICKKYKIGEDIRLVGRLKQNKWTDSEGKKHSEVIIISEHIEKKEDIK